MVGLVVAPGQSSPFLEVVEGPFDDVAALQFSASKWTGRPWDRDAERFLARSFENHGPSRDCTMTFDGLAVRLDGEYQRSAAPSMRPATRDDAGDTQTVAWQWRRGENWLPPCDRVAHRVDPHPA